MPYFLLPLQIFSVWKIQVIVSQSCPTLCDPMDCSLPDSSVHGHFPGKNTGMGCHALLQGNFSIQGSNPDLPHYRWILYNLSHQGSTYLLGASRVAQLVKNLSTMQETPFQFLGREVPLENGQATYSRIVGLPSWLIW